MTTIVTLKEWYGRLGNNLTQLVNAIYFSRKNNYIFVCKGVQYPKGSDNALDLYDGLLTYVDNKPTLHNAFIQDFAISFNNQVSVELDYIDKLSSLPILSDMFYYDNNTTVPDVVISNSDRRDILKKLYFT